MCTILKLEIYILQQEACRSLFEIVFANNDFNSDIPLEDRDRLKLEHFPVLLAL